MNHDALCDAIIDLEQSSYRFAKAYCRYDPKDISLKSPYARLCYAFGSDFESLKVNPGSHETCVDIGNNNISELSAHQVIERIEDEKLLVSKTRIVADLVNDAHGIGHEELVVDLEFFYSDKAQPRLIMSIDRMSINSKPTYLNSLVKTMKTRFGHVSNSTPRGPLLKWRVRDFPVFAPTPGSAVCKYFAFNNLEFFDDMKRVMIPSVSRACDMPEVLNELNGIEARLRALPVSI